MSSMQMYKVIPTNKIVDEIYEKHVRNPLDEWVSGRISSSAKCTTEDISNVICLHIFGATYGDISRVTGVKHTHISNIVCRRYYPNVKIPFVKNIRMVRGKRVTYYDENKVIEYFNSLPPELKNVTLYQVIEDRLSYAAKLRK